MAASTRNEKGAAVVDFALVMPVLLVVFLLVFQLGLALHVRNTLLACATEGARAGARMEATPEDGVARTAELISGALSPNYASDITATTTSVGGVAVVEVTVRVLGADKVEVTVRAPIPVIGLLGPDRALEIHARAFAESQ